MSTHEHDPADGHDADAGGHDDHFDPEPATALSPGETASPAWLPILGAGLFLIGGTYFLASPSAPDEMAAPSASVSVSAAPPMMAPPTPMQPRPAMQPGAPRLGDPDIMNKVRQQLEKGVKPGQPPGPGQPPVPGQPPAPGQPHVIQLQPPTPPRP